MFSFLCIRSGALFNFQQGSNIAFQKRINTYLNFLNKTNSQTFLKKVNGAKHFGMEGVTYCNVIAFNNNGDMRSSFHTDFYGGTCSNF